jgi:carboxylesterase type B
MMFRKYVLAAGAALLALGSAFGAKIAMNDHTSVAIARIGEAPSAAAPLPPKLNESRLHAGACPVPVTIGGATICGEQAPNATAIAVFKGIRYASASRWENPDLLPPAATDATYFKPVCPQPGVAPSGYSEDCLFLNIWMPYKSSTPGPYPVMVFIHGGAFESGAGSLPTYDGTAFANDGVILVTLNYRLGPLGFLAVQNSQGMTTQGNFGLLDQQTALRWVKANISYFGGDPGRVTIFGESAGAMSVGLQTFDMPKSNPIDGNGPYGTLFQAAMMQSNPLGQQYLAPGDGKGQAGEVGNQFLTALCGTLPALKAKKRAAQAFDCSNLPRWAYAPDLLASIIDTQANFLTSTLAEQDIEDKVLGVRELPWQPVEDDSVVMGQPYNGYTGTEAIPMVIGLNQDEGVIFAALLASGMSQTDYANQPSYDHYVGIMGYTFGTSNTTTITDYPTDRYNNKINNGQSFGYYSARGQALANVITDFSFDCGALHVANALSGILGGPPVFLYYFSQSPFFDSYVPVDHKACDPHSTSNVCHGNELPYVFSQIELENSRGWIPRPGDYTLAAYMNKSWLGFAKNPTKPGLGWIPYTGGPNYSALTYNSSLAEPTDLDKAGTCHDLWFGFPPYGPSTAKH